MGTFGFVNIFVLLFVTARAIRRFGPRTIFSTALFSLSLSFLAYPFLNFFARRSEAGGMGIFVIMTIILQMCGYMIIYWAYGNRLDLVRTNFILTEEWSACTQIFIADSAPTRNSLGGVTGISQMMSSIIRSLSPSVASSLFAVSAKHNLLNGNLVYAVLFVITLIGLRASFLLPKRLRSEGGS
jgi:hypothetical protein